MFFSVLSFTLLQQYLDASEQSISLLKDECSVKKSAVRGALAFLCVYTVLHMLYCHSFITFHPNCRSSIVDGATNFDTICGAKVGSHGGF